MSSKLTKIVISTIVASLCFTILPPASSAHADTLGQEECFPAVLMLRGSAEEILTTNGEPGQTYKSAAGNDLISTNGGEGEVLSRILNEFALNTNPSETVSKVRFVGIEYPALPVFPEVPKYEYPFILMDHVLKYDESYRKGAEMTASFIREDQKRGCETQYMIMSYSQGVIAARLAMNLLNNETEKIVSSFVVGDPFQKANGATSVRQKSEANTSSDTTGVGQVASGLASKVLAYTNNSFYQPLIDGIQSYTEEMQKADPIIYRDDGDAGIVSRALCHLEDPTCGIADVEYVNMNQHLNYFDAETGPGNQDLLFEVEEFDNQVKALANTAASNPRERTLVKTPSISGSTTSYNVVNTRSDVYNSSGVLVTQGDRCSWDENSDGTEELVNVPCDIHNVNHVSSTAKMTVTVTDTFGIEYVYTLDAPTIPSDSIEKLIGLDPNQWYQFSPYIQPNNYQESCVNVWHPDNYPMSDMEHYLSFSKCFQNPARDNWGKFQIFKSVPYQTSNEGTKTRILSGYDDNYSWDSFYSMSPGLGFMYLDNENQDFTPKLSRVIDGVPYYIFEQNSGCLYSDRSNVSFESCDYTSDNEKLFKAKPISGEFGDLSVDRDITPPNNVGGFHVEVSSSTISLKWNTAFDQGNGLQVDKYEIYQKDSSTGEMALFAVLDNANFYTFPILQLGAFASNEFEIVGVDYAGNKSLIPTTLTFVTPENQDQPSPPTVANVSADGTSITLNFPSVISNRNIRLFDYGAAAGISMGADLTMDIVPGRRYLWTYQVEIAPNVYTEKSPYLIFRSN